MYAVIVLYLEPIFDYSERVDPLMCYPENQKRIITVRGSVSMYFLHLP